MSRRTYRKPLVAAVLLGCFWSLLVLVGVGIGSWGTGSRLNRTIADQRQEITARAEDRSKLIASANKYIEGLSVEIAIREMRLNDANAAIKRLQSQLEFSLNKFRASL